MSKMLTIIVTIANERQQKVTNSPAAPHSKYPYRVVVVQFRRTPSIVDASGTGSSAIDKAANPQGS
jgi:hypothetical protein